MPYWEIEYKAWQWERRKRYLKPLPPEFEQVEDDQSGGGEVEWEPAPEVTEADRQNDIRSLNRALTKRLHLLVKKKGTRSRGVLSKGKT